MNGFTIAILAVIAIILAVFVVDFFCLKVKRYSPVVQKDSKGGGGAQHCDADRTCMKGDLEKTTAGSFAR